MIEKEKKEFRVHGYLKARDGSLLPYCSIFTDKGHLVSDFIRKRSFVRSAHSGKQSSNFLELSGKYIIDDENAIQIGEHNSQNQLHGQGIYI